MEAEQNYQKKYWWIVLIIVPIIVPIFPILLKNCINKSSYQNWSIKGRILDNSTKLPIKEAKVTFRSDGIAKRTSSDSEGIYRFSIQATSSKLVSRVKAESTGYLPYNRSLELISDATNIDDIFLIPLPAATPPPTIIASPTPNPIPTTTITLTPDVIPAPIHDIALLIVNDENTINWNISHKIAAQFREKGINVTIPFSDSFVSKGSFEKIFRGNPEEADKAGLLKYGSYAILGKISGSFVEQSEKLLNIITTKRRLEIHVVESKTGIITNSAQFMANGAAFDQEMALDSALHNILEAVEQQIETLLPQGDHTLKEK